MGSKQINTFRNKHVGFVFQFYHLLDELNVLENVTIAAMSSKSTLGWLKVRKNVKKRAKELLSRLGLENRIKHKAYQLSGGERQRVAIARALMNEPEVILADEPTGNLDSDTGNGILNIFEQLNCENQTIIMVTHDQRIAERTKRIIKLQDGVISDF
jgi:ABC-type lipoprotein export system ATPase subunit